METVYLKLKGGTFLFKLGLKGLMYLSKVAYKDERTNFFDLLYAGLIANQPDIKREEVEDLVEPSEIDSILAMIDSKKVVIPPSREIEGWFKKGLGEIGLPLDSLYCLTPYELDLAYEGYLRRRELEANLTKLAFLQATRGDTTPIQVIPTQEVHKGSLQEREEMFTQLGIKEEMT